ncbi:DUF1467 family protein [Mesorhizobium sp. NBSH29]|uniref:DUF1467 family protein n=1 Tax=Mesorhizobium sp. NBSH29 TaxID=2654249 RepID=UPI00189663C0|nr:DUF1467 family protein [Mesorhizobium sp. NBSH29]QPC87480.1 DUF1467 family protein [Mesorhizobium sp. NBSH29]
MSWVSFAAIFFIIWWTALFAALPFGLRTQDDDGNVTLGTHSSAPRGAHVRRAFLRTTIISIVVFGIFYLITKVYGFGVDDFPSFIPPLVQ